jgi:hypothetical protein
MDQLARKLKDAKASHPNSAPLIDMIQGVIETGKHYHLRIPVATTGIFNEEDLKKLSEELKDGFYFTKEADYNCYIISWEAERTPIEQLCVSRKFKLFH